jgi:hypothetical protein
MRRLLALALVPGCWTSTPELAVPIVDTGPRRAQIVGRVLFDARPVESFVVGFGRDGLGDLPTAAAYRASDGRFRITNVAPGKLEIVVTAPGLGRYVTTRSLAREGTVDLGDVVLPEGFYVNGGVFAPGGAHVANADVSLIVREGKGARSVEQDLVLGNLGATTDARGEYLIRGYSPVRGTVARIVARTADGRASWWSPVDAKTSHIFLEVFPSGSIEGATSRTRRGHVLVAPYFWKPEAGKMLELEDGRFRLDHVPEGSYQLQIIAPDGVLVPPTTVAVTAGAATTVVLP